MEGQSPESLIPPPPELQGGQDEESRLRRRREYERRLPAGRLGFRIGLVSALTIPATLGFGNWLYYRLQDSHAWTNHGNAIALILWLLILMSAFGLCLAFGLGIYSRRTLPGKAGFFMPAVSLLLILGTSLLESALGLGTGQ